MDHYFTNNNLKSNLNKVLVKIRDKSFNFYTDNGVFSKKGLDFGSRSLINALLNENLEKTALDVGCGYGCIGIILSSFFNIKIDMIDINKRAVHLANMNIKENNAKNIQAFESNIYQNVTKKYDYIITNPPIRAGKNVVHEILFNSKNYLNKNGILYFVINKDQGAKSIIKELQEISKIEILDKNKGFFVIKCIFNWHIEKNMVII